MISFSAKDLSHAVFAVLAFALFFSCSRETPERPLAPESHLNSKDYNGGLFPVWITLKEPVESVNLINWKSGNSQIAFRRQKIDTATKTILADTAFLYWETPPEPFLKIDSTEIKSNCAGEDPCSKSYKLDTAIYYRDTISAIIDGFESEPIIIEIKNILPRITSLSVGGLSQPGDSLLIIAAHPGDKLEIAINLEKPF